MWKPEHRFAAYRSGLRYPSNLTCAEWVIVEPMIPPAKHGGRTRTIDVRKILNGIFYVLSRGCRWQAPPKDLPPKRRHGPISTCGAGRHAGAHPSRALRGGTRAEGTEGKPDHGDHRQPEREGRTKRGASLDPGRCCDDPLPGAIPASLRSGIAPFVLAKYFGAELLRCR
jgi:hypothetical protein